MSQATHRVVETTWGATGRVTNDIGSTWKSPKAAREELNALQRKHPKRFYSLESRKGK